MKKQSHDGEPPVAELTRRVERARALITEVRGLFPEAHPLAKGDRLRSQGRLGIEEATALRSVVEVIDAKPEVFASLADEDAGHDPEKVETELLRERFDRHALYSTLSSEIEDMADLLADAALTMGALVKPVTLAAYEIAKPVSKRDPLVRGKLAPALDYYTGNAAVAAAAKRAKQAAKKAPPS